MGSRESLGFQRTLASPGPLPLSRPGPCAPHLCSAACPRRPAAGGPRGPRGSGLGRAAPAVRGAEGGAWGRGEERGCAGHRPDGTARRPSEPGACDWLCNPGLLQASASLADSGKGHPGPGRKEGQKALYNPEACVPADCQQRAWWLGWLLGTGVSRQRPPPG